MIKKIAFKDLLPIMDDMKKDGILLSEKATIFGFYDNGSLVAVTGVIFRGKKAYFKMSYTIPSMRKRGIFRKLLAHCISYSKSKGIKSGYANCTESSINTYMSFGGIVTKEYKNGIKRVEYAVL
jgi:GNAT superfamily N-acetyltransferase